jgi:hypothetical protein
VQALVATARSRQEVARGFRHGDQLLAMAASYDPDPTQFLGIRLPVTIDTCELIEERWANWSRQDPVTAVESQAGNLRRLKALYIDCGEKDQFNLLYGTRRLVRRLNELGIGHRYEEFPDNHTGARFSDASKGAFQIGEIRRNAGACPRWRARRDQVAGLPGTVERQKLDVSQSRELIL